MNIEIIKQVISDYLPDDIIVSKINVTENAGKLMVEIGWDLKDSKPEFKTPISDIINTPEFKEKLAAEVSAYPVSKALEQSEYQKCKSIMFDGYAIVRPFFNLDQSKQCKTPVSYSINTALNTPEARLKLASEFASYYPESVRNVGTNGPSEPSKYQKCNELRKTFPVTPVLDIDISPKPVFDKVVATKGSDKYISGLIRAGINPERAREMAGQAAGKIISGIDWAKPILETKTTTTKTITETPKSRSKRAYEIANQMVSKGMISEAQIDSQVNDIMKWNDADVENFENILARSSNQPPSNEIMETYILKSNTKEKNPEHLKVRRTEPDGYTVIGEDGKLVERKRFAKKPSEVIDEYKNAIESYTKRFNILGKLPGVYNKGKRNAVSITPHALPFSDPNRKISDVEIMLLSTEKFPSFVAKSMGVPGSILETLKTAEKQIGTPNRLTKVMFHLNAIKNVILGK
jgi:hypothetical protein